MWPIHCIHFLFCIPWEGVKKVWNFPYFSIPTHPSMKKKINMILKSYMYVEKFQDLVDLGFASQKYWESVRPPILKKVVFYAFPKLNPLLFSCIFQAGLSVREIRFDNWEPIEKLEPLSMEHLGLRKLFVDHWKD